MATHPENWFEILSIEMYFERGFEELEGYDHFYWDVLRGFVRLLQLRTADAAAFLKSAEEKFSSYERTTENFYYYFRLRQMDHERCILEEVANRSDAKVERTNQSCERLQNLTFAESNFDLWRSQTCQTAIHKLLRGDLSEGLDLFNELIEEYDTRFDKRLVSYYTFSAAAARILGDDETADRYNENAVIGIDKLEKPYFVALNTHRIAALNHLWGRNAEKEEWEGRIQTLELPRDTREIFERKSALHVKATQSTNCVCFF